MKSREKKRLVVRLKRAARYFERENKQFFYILCPFHGEKTPSMRVSKHTGHMHCLSCGVKRELYSERSWRLINMIAGKRMKTDRQRESTIEYLIHVASLQEKWREQDEKLRDRIPF